MSPHQIRRRAFLLVLLLFLSGSLAWAGPIFNVSEITCTNDAELIPADLDGDGLKDLVLLDHLNLAVFYQDARSGFTKLPQQTCPLESRPCLVWAARLGQPAESLLVMTSDGVTELDFTNRTGPPARRMIIRQPTIIPEQAEETNATQLPLSVATGGDWPLLLVPVSGGLQVWQHRDDWRLAQTIRQASESSLWPSVIDPGYDAAQDFDLSVGDVNGDGRDDLIIGTGTGDHRTYRLYLQQTNGLFAPDPAMTYTDQVEPFSWLCWTDLNRDGKVDLIKSVWLNGPSFIPGVPSAKVLVRTYVADAQGRIPAGPQQVFRKNDWMQAVPVLDVDRDGYPDLVLGFNHLESKESVSKEITARKLDYTLKFYFYRPGTGYPAAADCQQDIAIHLDHAEALFDWNLPDNFERYVTLGGDFSGNGRTDLLVRDHADLVSVYSFVSRTEGFGSQAMRRFTCPGTIDEWRVADLNHDGVSDLIVKMAAPNGWRIFISQK